jgi:hypothetical protein
MSAKFIVFAMALITLAGTPLPGHSQASDNRTIQVLLKDVPGAPTPAQLVDYCNTWPHAVPPPLQAFAVKDPQGGNWLLPERASGDFLAWLQANPNSVRNKLELSTLIMFPDPADIPAALAALQADPFVEAAEAAPATDFHVARTETGLGPVARPTGGGQYGWDTMNLDAAWQLTGGGYALIAQIDAGLYVDGPAFRQFSGGGSYLGGNYIWAASKDVGLTGQPEQDPFEPSDLDEAKAMFIAAGECTPVDAYLPPARLGHGTHVAGLLSANGASGQGVKGTCKHCGIAAYRAVFLECQPDPSPPQVLPSPNSSAGNRAKTEAIDTGVQALSMSYGFGNSPFYDCGPYRNQPNCLTIAYAVSRDAAMIASSGNDRTELNFPASDPRVISAGGFQSDGPGNLAFWDESPGGAIDCPLYPSGRECGSDFSKLYTGNIYRTHQEMLGSAQKVLSTTYPNTNYNDDLECGDAYGTPMGDGIGWCTGTSMAAPQIAGLVGLLRTVNPLVPIGEPEPVPGSPAGLRTVLAQSATQAQAGQPWNPYFGYGIPDAAAAARKMLGKVAGVTIRNRATPLFRLYNAYAKDFAEITSPQYALSLMITQVHNYVQPSAGLGAQPVVPGYAFPYDPNDPAVADDPYESAPAAPRAAIYVLTTDVRPRSEWPSVIPLHLMSKINATVHDYLLVTPAHIEAAHNDGYDLRTIQGYIFQPCNPEPACIPPAAEPIYRACKSADTDCAVFLESERAVFEANGYIGAYPAGAAKKLGYAYPATDSDADGLPDGFEYAVGTSPTRADSDGDGAADAAEFPLAGIAISDPCAGGTNALYCPANSIFEDGFDGF